MQPTSQPSSTVPGADRAANPAQTVGILLAVCALALAIGMFTRSWGTASEGRAEIAIGLVGIEGCHGGDCRALEWSRAGRTLDLPGDVTGLRIPALLLAIAALGAVGTAAGLALSGRVRSIPVKPLVGVIATAAGLLTLWTLRLATSDRDVDIGPGFSAFLAVGALVAASALLRTKVRALAAA